MRDELGQNRLSAVFNFQRAIFCGIPIVLTYGRRRKPTRAQIREETEAIARKLKQMESEDGQTKK